MPFTASRPHESLDFVSGSDTSRQRDGRTHCRSAGLSKKKYIHIKIYILSKRQLISIKNKISFHKELRLPLRTALAALRDVNLDVRISWQAQHFERLQ